MARFYGALLATAPQTGEPWWPEFVAAARAL